MRISCVAWVSDDRDACGVTRDAVSSEKSLDGKEDVIVNEPAPLTIRTEVRRMESV